MLPQQRRRRPPAQRLKQPGPWQTQPRTLPRRPRRRLAEMAEAAIAAAMTELHIDGTVKSLGDSTVDATAGTLIDQEDETTTEYKTFTGFRSAACPETWTRSPGFHSINAAGAAPVRRGSRYDTTGHNTTDVEYVQAVEDHR